MVIQEAVMDMLCRLDLPLCDLGENPLWHGESDEFVFTDITNGALWAWNPDQEELRPRLLLNTPYLTGAFVFDQEGDIILFTEKGIFHVPYDGAPDRDMQLICQLPLAEDERFNDAICDPEGRIFAGTKTERNEEGSLWKLETCSQPVRILTSLSISNGMGFSPDCRTFYHTDSGKRTITRWDYDRVKGEISCPHPLVQLTDNTDTVPDGMTVDEEGAIWSAIWGGACIRRFDARFGQQIGSFPLPGSQTSSLIFGGKDLKRILVTSAACEGASTPSGAIWCLKSQIRGREEYRAAY